MLIVCNITAMFGSLILSGGVDFNNPIWEKNKLKLFTTIEELIIQLQKAKELVEERKRLFNDFKCKNFEQFKRQNPHWNDAKRLILVFDEVAEFLDKDRYITKEEKEQYTKIVTLLSSLAGIGRAFRSSSFCTYSTTKCKTNT